MKDSFRVRTIGELRQKLYSLRQQAQAVAIELEGMRRQAESLKVRALINHLDRQRKLIVEAEGMSKIMNDGEALRTSLAFAAGVALVTGILSKDRLTAANAGLSTLNGVLQEAGRTDCAVSLDRLIKVVQKNRITSARTWYTWESTKSALSTLEVEGSAGSALGSLDSIISRVRGMAAIILVSTSH